MSRTDPRCPRICTYALLIFCVLCAAPSYALDMKAGVAKTVISNDKPLVMVNGRISDGVLEDIHARVLVLNDGTQRLIIVTYDLNCLDVATPYVRERVRKELGIDSSFLILLATHNHNAPIQINPDNFEYGRQLADRIFDAIEEAIAAEQGPVQLLFSSGDGYFITSSGNAPTDYEIQLLRVMKGDEPIAFLFNHGTHPLQASRTQIDPGHPGYAMNDLEEMFPGVQAMYADAAGGNQFPLRPKGFDDLPRRPRGRAGTDERRVAAAKSLGKELAETVATIAKSPAVDVTGPITSSMQVLSLPLAPPISRDEALELAKDFPADVGFVTYPNKWRDTNWVRMLLYWYEKNLPFPKTTTEMICTDDTYFIHKSDKAQLEKYDDSIHDTLPCVYEEVIVAKIGNMPFVAMQGEVCAPIGARIKDAFRREMPIMLFAYMGEHNLYIPTREIVRLDAYQSQVIRIQYASPVGWAPEVEDEMVRGVVGMVEAITKN